MKKNDGVFFWKEIIFIVWFVPTWLIYLAIYFLLLILLSAQNSEFFDTEKHTHIPNVR